MKTYIVALNKDVDYDQFWAEIEDPTTGLEYIPDRPVAIVNNRDPFLRICEYALTDAEAEKLKQDPRVAGVDIPIEDRNDVSISLMATETQNFTKPSGTQSSTASGGTNVNWGLIRNNNPTNVYGTGNTTSLNYNYVVDGTGVDVVISDTGIQADHPEFQYVGNSTSRVQQINWATYVPALSTMGNCYQDSNGHGTNVCGIATGKTFGWAKGSQIYSILYTANVLDQFQAILLWHQSKGVNGRPTVVNMSWGTTYPYQTFGATPTLAINNFLGNISSVTYQGVTHSGNANVTNYGLLLDSSNANCVASMSNRFPYPSYDSYDVALQELLDNGIVVCKSAGNNSYKIDVPGGVDYNNYVTAYGGNARYHQGSSPNAANAIVVGSIDVNAYSSTQDQKVYFSCAGPGVDVYAAGVNIMSAGTSNVSATDYSQTNVYFLNNSYRQYNDTGTSQASPQIAGMTALYLQTHPLANNLSSNNCSQVKSWITSSATSTMYSPGNATTYTNFTSTLGGNATVAYQAIQGLTQIKNSGNTWAPVANVYVKTVSSWETVEHIWTKTADGWAQTY